jgi:hypothetical protein
LLLQRPSRYPPPQQQQSTPTLSNTTTNFTNTGTDSLWHIERKEEISVLFLIFK